MAMVASALRSAASAGLVLSLSAQAQGITAIFQDGQSPTSRYAGTTDVIITEHVDFDRAPDANYSDRAYLQVDGFSARQTSLLRFPFGPGALPAGASITGAALKIYVNDATSTGPAVYEVLRSWDETQATYLWPRSGQSWDSPGASSPGVDRGDVVLGTVPAWPDGGWTIIPLTDAGVDLVRSWYRGASPNNGVIFQDYESWDELYFDSVDGPNPPRLEVFYVAGFPDAGAVASFVPSADTMLAYQPPNFDGWGVGASGLGGELAATLIRWDLRAIPPGVSIAGAEMDFTVNRIGSSIGGSNAFQVYAAAPAWTEKADWFTYDGQNPWGAPGAGSSADKGPGLDLLPACNAPGQTCPIDLSQSRNTIRGWTNAPSTNQGFLIENYAVLDQLQLFDSEAPVTARRPRLVVSFTWTNTHPTAVFPAFADVVTGERVQMQAFGGDGGYQYSVSGASDASIDPAGTYVAGPTPGVDYVRVVDQGGAGVQAIATITVHQGRVVSTDGGTPTDGGGGGGGDGGGGFLVSLALAGPTEAVEPRGQFVITADVVNQATFPLFGMTLALAPDGLEVAAPEPDTGPPLQASGTGYALPTLGGGQAVHLAIPTKMIAVPPASPSLTATVSAGGVALTTATFPVELGSPGRLTTGCKCDSGAGGLSVVVVLAVARALRRRARSAAGA